ncbi:probable anion transporter 5, chloroplastic isoform X2 [Brachypodium distachyon]|uniref:probable anion transporter 5, chloroplastic isoform X2 n=1 Tax=Brachypodium distachyon TaxID=15368 RepID=UPI0001C719F9|nr:probable anion transporter 5, chloroplastic isoform X2 [Brachypodium distachyon]|eukprot:XP_003578623.1 probable anion transporter 5, chloroplastic isoform X2 [Brachypodium distachyon]
MAASSAALRPELYLLAAARGRHHHLLRMLPPRAPLLQHRRCRRRPLAVRFSTGDSGSGGGSAGAVEKRSVPEVTEEKGEDREEEVAGALELRWPPWEGIPERYRLMGATSLAFVICNMDKVNLSVAIIPMSHQYGWNSSTAGLVQSSFFWGYALSQLPGGWLAKLVGGRRVLKVGVLAWSLSTAIIPAVAGFMPGLVLSRILVGIGEGVSPSAATDLIARTIPLQERSRAVAVVFGGLSFGSVLGLLFAPPIIQNLGWESVFYIFGLLGIIWCLGFESLKDLQSGDNEDTLNSGQASAGSNGHISSSMSSKSSDPSLEEMTNSIKDVPWRNFFKSKAVWAMIYAHFCGSWGHYTCLSWLPTFFSEELNLNLTEAAWVSILPPLGSMIITSIAAPFADNLISSGVDTTKVRKICQTIAFVSPAAFMMLSSVDLGLPPWEIVAFLTSGLALSSFALSGLYCTHQDISREYASILLGITNTVGAVPGIVGVALTGYLVDTTHSWSISLFAPSVFFYLTGTAVWLAFANSEPQDFSEPESE